jgi:hypothetical protein
MLFRQRFLDGIRDGTITLAFRRWRRPSVRSGGTLLTAIGQLSITSVDEVATTRISDADAQRAGYASRGDLLAELETRDEGQVYRIELGAVHADPRVRLRQSASLSSDERHHLADRLRRLDERSTHGPWTRQTLDLIRSRPGVRAADLCRLVGMEMHPFKVNVRKLKTLGLTESLEVGYRLSPRGAAFIDSSGS